MNGMKAAFLIDVVSECLHPHDYIVTLVPESSIHYENSHDFTSHRKSLPIIEPDQNVGNKHKFSMQSVFLFYFSTPFLSPTATDHRYNTSQLFFSHVGSRRQAKAVCEEMLRDGTTHYLATFEQRLHMHRLPGGA